MQNILGIWLWLGLRSAGVFILTFGIEMRQPVGCLDFYFSVVDDIENEFRKPQTT